jgi:5-methyltetrahydrofolate--homocysteine methyltransferase
MSKPSLHEIAKKKILILDGAMGTMIQRHKLEEEDFRNDTMKDIKVNMKGNNDLLSLTRPEIIQGIHEQYFEAGADLVETNTFSGTTIAQADYECESFVYDINYESAKLAVAAAEKYTKLQPEKPRYVVGAMGPTNKTASLSPDVNDPGYRAITFDQLVTAYAQQAEALIEGGVDALLIETIFDTLNAKAALYAVKQTFEKIGKELPIMVSGTITDASGRTLSGQTTEAFLISVSHIPLFSVGLNCALGASQLRPYLQILAKESEFLVSAYPNAGLPNEFGEYEETPEQMAEQVREYCELNLVNVLGGCCGTTPEHIAALAKLAAEFSPRNIEH